MGFGPQAFGTWHKKFAHSCSSIEGIVAWQRIEPRNFNEQKGGAYFAISCTFNNPPYLRENL